MSATKIDQAFINTFVDGGFGLSIAHENLAFEPTAGTEYAELINLPNDITPLSVNDTNNTDGIFRIILYWPVNEGSIQAKTKADEILAVFSIGTRVCYDSQCAIVTRAARYKGVVESTWYHTVITIGYTAFLTQ